MKLGSSWKSLSIIYDRHGRNFNQTFKWGFAKTRRISYRKRVTGRVWHSASSYFSILEPRKPCCYREITHDETSCRDLPFRETSLKVSRKICHSLSPLFNFNSFLKISFSILTFRFSFKSRMKAVIENRYNLNL